jgi:hypothetical protein
LGICEERCGEHRDRSHQQKLGRPPDHEIASGLLDRSKRLNDQDDLNRNHEYCGQQPKSKPRLEHLVVNVELTP